MGGFRRFVLFVFSLAGIACLAALALPWFGLFDHEFALLGEYEAYYVAVEVCLGMTAAWLLCNLGRSLFSRKRKALSVMTIDGGKITVTRNAVASQAAHIVNASGLGTSKNVDVRAGKRGPVDVTVKVAPFASFDVTSEAPQLHAALVSGLTAMCAERLGTIDIEFLEPREQSSLADVDDAYDDDASANDASFTDEPDAEASAAMAYDAPAQLAAPEGEEASEASDAEDSEGSGAEAGTERDALDGTGDITIPIRSEREA